jgi:alcohol dehydrogenase YqhD (iron-dependent ADH family)
MKHVFRTDLPRFAGWASRVFNIEIDPRNFESTALKGIETLENFYRSLNMPVRLSDVDIDTERFEEMANKATNNGAHTLGSFVPLTKEDILAILELAK